MCMRLCDGVGQLRAGLSAIPIFRTSGLRAVGMDGFAQLNRGPRLDSQFGLGILGWEWNGTFTGAHGSTTPPAGVGKQFRLGAFHFGRLLFRLFGYPYTDDTIWHRRRRLLYMYTHHPPDFPKC